MSCFSGALYCFPSHFLLGNLVNMTPQNNHVINVSGKYLSMHLGKEKGNVGLPVSVRSLPSLITVLIWISDNLIRLSWLNVLSPVLCPVPMAGIEQCWHVSSKQALVWPAAIHTPTTLCLGLREAPGLPCGEGDFQHPGQTQIHTGLLQTLLSWKLCNFIY